LSSPFFIGCHSSLASAWKVMLFTQECGLNRGYKLSQAPLVYEAT